MTTFLNVSELTLFRADFRLCDNWSMQLREGECIHLSGDNGSGKTSMLQALTGFLRPECGTISWAAGGAERLAHYCGHQDALKSVWTVAENLRWQLMLDGGRFDAAAWHASLDAMQLADLIDTPVSQLSQGQRRRAALTRLALIPRRVWLLDEPFNALDYAGRACLTEWINRHIGEGGAVLFTSHIDAPAPLRLTRRIAMDRTP